MRLIGWRVEGPVPDLPKMVVIGAPHTSNYDFVVAMATMFSLGLNLNIMGKHTLFRWPMGGFMRWCGLIAINRSAAHGVVGETVQAFGAADRLWIGIAPEGTRSSGGDTWKSGFWQIARQAGVPVLPIAIDYAARAVRFGPPFETTSDVHADMVRLSNFYGGVQGARRTIPSQIGVRVGGGTARAADQP
ncbi:MAG: hypothetical protein RLY86_794 [Pseudomonadota bacterium]|jgi:1-acyl-sn-glycerol-3-phosphate acyltransferase